jgi:hypothetical protein
VSESKRVIENWRRRLYSPDAPFVSIWFQILRSRLMKQVVCPLTLVVRGCRRGNASASRGPVQHANPSGSGMSSSLRIRSPGKFLLSTAA